MFDRSRHPAVRAIPAFVTLLCLFVIPVPGSELRAGKRERFAALRVEALRLSDEGQVAEAIPYFRKMLALQPYNETALYLLALALLHQENKTGPEFREDCREAARLLERAAVMQERYRIRGRELGLRYFYLGMAYWYAGESLKALSAFRRSYRADFERLDAVYNQFSILEELGKTAEARAKLKRYRELLARSEVDD